MPRTLDPGPVWVTGRCGPTYPSTNQTDTNQHPTKERTMTVLIENGPHWPAYQYVIKELVTNGYIDVTEHPEWYEDRATKTKDGRDKQRGSRLGLVLASLSRPSTHRARIRHGLTVDTGRGRFTGAVIRIGQGKYIYDRDMVITGHRHDTLLTADEEVKRWNRQKWDFRAPKGKTEDVEVVPEVEELEVLTGVPKVERPRIDRSMTPGLLSFKRDMGKPNGGDLRNVPSVTGIEVLARDGDRIVLRQGPVILLATVTDEIKATG